MPETVEVQKLDEVYLKVLSEPGIERELAEAFKFRVPGFKHMPAYKAGYWDGNINLYSTYNKTMYAGLYPKLVDWVNENGYSVDFQSNDTFDAPFYRHNEPEENLRSFINELKLVDQYSNPIEVRDYQFDGIKKAIEDYRTILISPTGSGKSLMIYVIMRWIMARHTLPEDKIIILVPGTSLVEQMYSDFETYSKLDTWSVNDHCQKLYAAYAKDFKAHKFTKQVLISTWQSVFKQPREFFSQFITIFGDEAHKFKAKMLTGVMEKMDVTPYRIGTTGTLDNHQVHQLVLEGLFGPILKVATTKELMDRKQLADLKITCLLLKYPDAECKILKKYKYQDEIHWIVANDRRNNFIRNLALSTKGNTLVLFNLVEKHGKKLYDLINAKAGGRTVYLVYGGTETEQREEIRRFAGLVNNAIIIASYGVFSQGINIPSLENIIFASPSKSKIRNLQSIGRGLRTAEGKTVCNLYDIADDLHWKSWNNHTLRHFMERIKIYAEEQFEFKTIEVKI